MVQIPIISGIYASTLPELRTSYPVNLVPVPKQNGISEGFLRPADGLEAFVTGPGADRGGINWNGVCYRVMGPKLVSVDSGGILTVLGDVDDDSQPVTLDYGFDRLAIASAGKLFYWDGTTLTEVTDPDLGTVVDVLWVDGYYMTTDGEFLIVTELNDPTSINPVKYGSSEADPDPINAILKLRNEVVALNRHTIEYFDNVGGDLFPFARIEGAQVEKGCIGTYACCLMSEVVAFMGSGFNEAISIYAAANATAVKLSTQEIDTILAGYSEEVLAQSVLEVRREASHEFLHVHLPDRTLVYDAGASAEMQRPVWFTLSSGAADLAQYRARFFVRAYDQWIAGDPQEWRLCTLTRDVSTHYGEDVAWEFGTLIVYGEGRGAIFNELELVALTGSVTGAPVIATSYSLDGVTWSSDRVISAGNAGQRGKRLVWMQQGHMRNWRVQRFQGTSAAHISPIRLEARLEPLAY